MEYAFTNDRSEFIVEPKGFIKQLMLEVDGKSIENPLHESHKRGKNWAAVMKGPNAADPQRDYLNVRGRTVDLQEVKAGDPFVVAGDYVSSGGVYHPDRIWCVVNRLTDTEMVLDIYETEAKAISASRKGARAVPLTMDVSADDGDAMAQAFPIGMDFGPAPVTVTTVSWGEGK